MHALLQALVMMAAIPSAGESLSAPAWEKVFDGGSDRWASTVTATGQDAWFVGGAWGIATGTKAATNVESTHGHGVLRFFVESPTSVYALGEGELIWHFDGMKWTEEHVGPLPPRNQRRPFAEHMLYLAHYSDPGSNGPLTALGLVLVLVKQPDGTWMPPPKDDAKKLLSLGHVGPQIPEGPAKCHGRGWRWLGRNRAFFTCNDRRAFIYDSGAVTPKGKFPRQCGSTISSLAQAGSEVYVTCGATVWKTDREQWRPIEAPKERLREFSSISFAGGCLFVAGNRTVWRRCYQAPD